jgi:hypothetical protein
VSKRTDSRGLGSLGSGALTAGSLLVVSAVAAFVGVVIARKFGRTQETDGLLAAYGAFVVIVIASQAIRVAVLPDLARARHAGRLAGELAGFALALATVGVPLVLVAELGADQLAWLLTGNGSEVARSTAADALRWMVPAAVAQLFAGLAASGLAALDDYGTAAFGYAAGSAAGLALIVLRVDSNGIVAVAWGMTLNGTIALLVPVAGLALRAARAGMPSGAVRPSGPPLRVRLGAFAVGAALPLALQLLYVVSVPFAGRLGTGDVTSFVYAYLAASALVTVSASSIGLVTAVPLTRAGLTDERVTQHVSAASWLAFVLVGAAAGALIVAGAGIVSTVLGPAYGGNVGAEIGRLVALLAPWMVAAVGVALTFPLVFIGGRTGWLPVVAGVAVLVQVPLAFAGTALLGLGGLALSLALTTWAILAILLDRLHVLGATLRRLLRGAVLVAALSAAAFVPTGLVFDPYTAAALGIGLYATLLALLRPQGLRSSWNYLRGLT